MTAPAAPLPATAIGRYLPAFQDVWKLISLTRHFVLVPVEIEGPELARSLAAWLTEQGHPALVIEPKENEDWEQLAAALLDPSTKPGPSGVVVVIGTRSPPTGVELGLRVLNQRRDTLVKHLDRPLLWCGPREFLNLTWERAPDLWSIRAVDRRIEASAASEKPASPGPPEARQAVRLGSRGAVRPGSRLRTLFDEAREQGDAENTARLGARLADALLKGEALDEAESVVARALEGLEGRGPDPIDLRAELFLRRAEVEHRRGSAVAAASTLSQLLGHPEVDPHITLRAELAMAHLYRETRDLRGAERTYKHTLERARRLGDREGEAQALTGMIEVAALSGQGAAAALAGELALKIARDLGDVEIETETRAALERARPHDDLLQRVLVICRLREERRGRVVKIARRAAPAPFHEHAEIRYVESTGETRTYAIAATEEALSRGAIETFRTKIHASYRSVDPGVVSTLVCAVDALSDALKHEAQAAGIHVVRLAEYQELIDFRDYVERQTMRLETDPVYLPGLYVPQRLVYTVGLEEHRSDDALAEVTGWLASPHARFVVVLGDFGAGKTFLLHELARRMAAGEGPLVPILVQMRALEKAHSLDALIAQHLTLAGMDRIDLGAFRYMLSEGRIALLFDGFDELALRVSYDRAAEHFATLQEAAIGNAKVVVTSRTQHFRSDSQVATALGERVQSIPGYRFTKLQPFSRPQIRRYLVNRLGSEEAAATRVALLDRVKDLLGLSENEDARVHRRAARGGAPGSAGRKRDRHGCGAL